MKLEDLKGIFSKFTTVKLVLNGDQDIFKGYFYNVPAIYASYEVESVIPIKNPDNDKLGMAAILIKEC